MSHIFSFRPNVALLTFKTSQNVLTQFSRLACPLNIHKISSDCFKRFYCSQIPSDNAYSYLNVTEIQSLLLNCVATHSRRYHSVS